MLQLKRISEVLAQGLLAPSEERPGRPLAVSLLAPSGLPLATVTATELETRHHMSGDNMKIYSLLGVNHLRQQAENEGKDASGPLTGEWTIVTLEKDLKLAIGTIRDDPMFVTILYDDSILSAVAKLKLDNVCQALTKGLEGY